MNDNIEQGIDFLEYSLWIQSAQKADGRMTTWEDQEGYRFEASRGIPSKVDMLFLYYLMLESQNNNWEHQVSVFRDQILKACGMTPSKEKRERLIQSLEAWKQVIISFSGPFYTGTGYKFLEFGIVNDWGIREDDNYLEVELNKKWIEKIKRSEFFKYINFAQMKQLRSPLTLRLYEILVKPLYQKTTWEIDVLNLAAKIPMIEKYFADIVPKIEAATRRIADKTDLQVKVETVKQGRGKGKFVFTKKQKPAPADDLFPEPETPPTQIPLELLEMIPEEWRENAVAEANKLLKIVGEDELKVCITKVNQSLKKGTEINSYGEYLRRCHDENCHEQKKSNEIKKEKDAIVQQHSEKNKAEKRQEEKSEQQILKAKHEAVDRIKSEEPDRYSELEQQAADKLGLKVKRPGIGGKIKIKFEIFRILKL